MLGNLLPLSLLGGLLGLDVVGFPQAMVSRPLVAATLSGALMGEALSGLLIGAALEMIALETLPFGASRYPEWGSAAVVGGAIFVAQPNQAAGSMVASMVAALSTAWIGGWTMVKLRKRNALWARRRRGALDAGARGSVIGLQLRGLTADFVRGALLTAAAYVVFQPIAAWAVGAWSVDDRLSRAWVVGIAASVGGAAMWKLYHAVPLARWLFLGGLVIGLALMGLR